MNQSDHSSNHTAGGAGHPAFRRSAHLARVARGFAAGLAVAATVGSATLAFANPPPGAGAPAQAAGQAQMSRREAFKAKFADARRKVLTEKVGLKGDKLETVLKIFERGDEKRMALLRERHRAFEALKRLNDENSPDTTQYTQAIDNLTAAHNQMHDFRLAQGQEIRAALTDKEFAKFLLAVPEMMKSMHGEMKGHHRRGRDPGMPPGHVDDNAPPPPEEMDEPF